MIFKPQLDFLARGKHGLGYPAYGNPQNSRDTGTVTEHGHKIRIWQRQMILFSLGFQHRGAVHSAL